MASVSAAAVPARTKEARAAATIFLNTFESPVEWDGWSERGRASGQVRTAELLFEPVLQFGEVLEHRAPAARHMLDAAAEAVRRRVARPVQLQHERQPMRVGRGAIELRHGAVGGGAVGCGIHGCYSRNGRGARRHETVL